MASRIAAGAFFIAIQAMVALATLDFLASLSRGRFALGDTNGSTWGSLLALAQVRRGAADRLVVDLHVPGARAPRDRRRARPHDVRDRAAGRSAPRRTLGPAPSPIAASVSHFRLRLPRLHSPLPALATFAAALPYVGPPARASPPDLRPGALGRGHGRLRAAAARLAGQPARAAADRAVLGRLLALSPRGRHRPPRARRARALPRRSGTRCPSRSRSSASRR